MEKVTVQVPMSKDLKKRAEAVSEGLGFSSLQESIRVMLTQFSNKEFSLKVNPEVEEITYLSPKAERKFKKAVADIKAGRNISKTENVEELIELLKL